MQGMKQFFIQPPASLEKDRFAQAGLPANQNGAQLNGSTSNVINISQIEQNSLMQNLSQKDRMVRENIISNRQQIEVYKFINKSQN